jgi:uncharacterized protein
MRLKHGLILLCILGIGAGYFYTGIPLSMAVASGSLGSARMLLDIGTPVNWNIRQGRSPFALNEAAYRGDLEMAKLLVRHGADVNGADRNGMTALHCAAKDERVLSTDPAVVGFNAERKDVNWKGRTEVALYLIPSVPILMRQFSWS